LEDESNDWNDPEEFDEDFSFVLGSRRQFDIRSLHPPPERIHQLWQIFTENVDPLTKVVHVPTIRPAIQNAANNIISIPRGFEALMFAIYSTAVMSLNEDECKVRFSESRKTLLSRYIIATKRALLRARFMETMSLIVLQAFVLHLLSVRDIYAPRTVWSLTGVAIRIAQSMGMERDGLFLGLSPFETEIRRRTWWLLKTYDYRTAELCGLSKFRDLDTGPESTKRPTNVNDDQLYPGMPVFLTDSKKLTDVVFIALRYDLVNITASRVAKFRQQGKRSSQWDRDLASGGDRMEADQAFREIEELLETKYLRYCDPSQPLHLMTMLMARAAMNTIRFLRCHPRRWTSIGQTPPFERQSVWEVSIKLLEQYSMLQSNSQLKQFAWHAAFVMQWHAFIHILDTLRAIPLTADAEKAWDLVEHIYENNPAMAMDMGKPIHVAAGILCLKAYNVRETTQLQNNNMCPPTAPEFILRLRQQQDVIQARRQAPNVKSNHTEGSVHDRGKVSDIDPTPDTGGKYLSNTLRSTHLHENTTTNQPGFLETGSDATNGDPFWFLNEFDDSQAGGPINAMDINLDSMLAQGGNLENNTSQTITWDQWDTWLAESSEMHQF
jgi:hypothetical protein